MTNGTQAKVHPLAHLIWSEYFGFPIFHLEAAPSGIGWRKHLTYLWDVRSFVAWFATKNRHNENSPFYTFTQLRYEEAMEPGPPYDLVFESFSMRIRLTYYSNLDPRWLAWIYIDFNERKSISPEPEEAWEKEKKNEQQAIEKLLNRLDEVVSWEREEVKRLLTLIKERGSCYHVV